MWPWMHHRTPDRTDPVGVWLLKWVFFPALLLAICYMIIDNYAGRRNCLQMARERGFVEAQYIPAFRYTAGACIMKKKRMPDGTIDNSAVLTVEMH